MASFYSATISEATGVTDCDDLDAIEDTMRHVIFHSALDWQTKAQLRKGAREAWKVVQDLRDPAVIALFAAEQAKWEAAYPVRGR